MVAATQAKGGTPPILVTQHYEENVVIDLLMCAVDFDV
jgi:hypothetical protein